MIVSLADPTLERLFLACAVQLGAALKHVTVPRGHQGRLQVATEEFDTV